MPQTWVDWYRPGTSNAVGHTHTRRNAAANRRAPNGVSVRHLPMTQPQLTEDEQAAIALSQDIDMARAEATKWATLAERTDSGAGRKLAEQYAEVWKEVIEEAVETSEGLDIDPEELQRKLSQPVQQPEPDEPDVIEGP